MLQVFHGISKCMASSSVDTSSDSSVAMHPDTNSTAASNVIDDDDSNVLKLPFTIDFSLFYYGQNHLNGVAAIHMGIHLSLPHSLTLTFYPYHLLISSVFGCINCVHIFFYFLDSFEILSVTKSKKNESFSNSVSLVLLRSLDFHLRLPTKHGHVYSQPNIHVFLIFSAGAFNK